MRQRGPDALRDTEVKLVQKVNTQINKRLKQNISISSDSIPGDSGLFHTFISKSEWS